MTGKGRDLFMARYWFLLKRWVALLGLTAVAAAAIFTVQTAALQRGLAEKTLRLHVVANSDTDADQAQKLRVRDAVLETVGALTEGCGSRAEAEQALGAGLGRVQAAAQSVLDAEGSGLTACVSLEEQRFGTRSYDTFTLPAGVYRALCVRIGAAQGHNWWCVVFPSLCTAASSEQAAQLAAAGGFDGDETELVTDADGYILRFKLLEWLDELFSPH